MLVSGKGISSALGLLAVLAGTTGFAAPPSRNQATADAVATALKSNAVLAGSPVSIEVRDGLVTLTGTVPTPALKAEAVGRAQGVPGVKAVVDRLQLRGDARIQPVQYQPTQVAFGGSRFSPVADGGMISGPVVDGGSAMMGPDGGPIPEGPAIPGAGTAGAPGMPNYAWPSYAPYPNFSAVGYPTVYPWQAWPNIGPFYPYPEVPLDWRAVTLRWDDGLWWLDFKKHYTRPFFTPYPLGIFGY